TPPAWSCSIRFLRRCSFGSLLLTHDRSATHWRGVSADPAGLPTEHRCMYGMVSMGENPLVSVVMAVRNGEQDLAESIQSILNQQFGDFEFIIIEDGSTDRTGERLGHYGQLDERIQVYTQEQRGHAASLNRGCGLARGKYLARMDADDVALPHRLARQGAFLQRNPQGAVLRAGAPGPPGARLS